MEVVAREIWVIHGGNVVGFTGKRSHLKWLLEVPMVEVKEVVGGVNAGNK